MIEEQIAVDDESAPSGDEDTLLTGDIEEELDTGDEEESQEDDDFVDTDNEKVIKRFGRLTAQRKEAEERAEQERRLREEAERENEELRRRVAEKTHSSDEEIVNRPEPDEDEFETIAEFHAALKSHYREVESARARIENRRESEEEQRQREWQSAISRYNSESDAARQKFEDFDLVVSKASLPLEVQAELIKESSPEMVYAMMKHHSDLYESLRNARTVIERKVVLGRLEERVKNPPKPRKITKAGGTVESPSMGGGTKPAKDDFDKRFPNAVIE